MKNLKGFMIRSKVDWNIDGGKPSKLFCNLEKNNYTTKTILSVINDDGTEISNQNDILKKIIFSKQHRKFK
jgi:hypothetical protein